MSCILLKARLMVNTPGHISTKGNQLLFLTPFEIVAIVIVPPRGTHRSRACTPEVSSKFVNVKYKCQRKGFMHLSIC